MQAGVLLAGGEEGLGAAAAEEAEGSAEGLEEPQEVVGVASGKKP